MLDSGFEINNIYLKNGIKVLGEIHFWKNFIFEAEGRPYMIINHDSNVETITQVMLQVWRMKSPRIVGLIISNIDSLKEWVNPRQIAHFQAGLIKAARSTNMWIFTNGANIGTSLMIGDAVLQETQKREMFRAVSAYQCPNLNFIGVIQDSTVKYLEMLKVNENGPNSFISKVNIENRGNIREEGKFELNPDHNNFLIVQDSTFNKAGINLFILKLLEYLSTFGRSSFDKTNTKSDDIYMEIPVVSILIQGGYDCARLVVECLKKRFPIVILRGSGGLADILSFAYIELEQKSRSARPWGTWDPEYIERLLKPELAEKIVAYFPRISDNTLARNLLRDRILEAVRLAKQDHRSFISVLNVHNYSECQLEKLSVYLLKALFQSKPFIYGESFQGQNIENEEIFKELHLTLDWNCPEVAKNEILIKNPKNILSMPKNLFQSALIRPNREEFVDLFLTYNFRIHKFITPKRLFQLFQFIHQEDFFRSVCWEGILGHSLSSRLSKNFIKSDLNWLIEVCTGLINFINQDHLYYNVMSMYIRDSDSAERQALTILAMWAAFGNRQKLAKVLWKHSDQPIHLGLMISLINKRLSAYVGETNIRDDLNKKSREFVDMAVGVLNECYKMCASRAFDVLSQQSADWNYKTAVELSANEATKEFLAHPCCQRWLTNTFLGEIRFRDSSCGLFALPLSFKILLSAFFIFPMFIWVRFKTTQDKKSDFDKPELEDEELKVSEYPNFLIESGSKETSSSQLNLLRNRRSIFKLNFVRLFQGSEVFIKPPFSIWKMINLMWSAPITKFYIFQIFYIFYLLLISIALLWPSCGNTFLDAVVCIWTALNVIEYFHKVWVFYHKFKSIPLLFKCLEIIVVSIFLIIFSLTIVPITSDLALLRPYGRKVALSFALLYFFYRFTAMYLPISPTLGPLLYRLKLMVMVDFVNFLKMALVIIISSGVVMQALYFPDLDLSWAVIKQAFTRAWLALFLTPTDDLSTDVQCNKYYQFSANKTGKCYAGSYNNTLSPYPCPENGLWPYFFTLQYFVLLKLILLTLLYALFASTASKLEQQTDAIWKYQRYLLVIDFANRIPLPSPICIFYYFYILLEFLYRILCCKPCKIKKKITEKTPFLDNEGKYNQRLSQADYNFWRYLAQEYSNKQEKEDEDKKSMSKLMDTIQSMNEELEYKKMLLRKISGRVSNLERMAKVSQFQMENIRLLVSMKIGYLGSSSTDSFLKVKSHNLLSRQSPYPETHVQKIPVPDKYIPWEVAWLEYDPVAYTKPKEDFSFELQPHVDEDFLITKNLKNLEEKDLKAKLPIMQWNCSYTNAAGIDIDRSSWILNEDGTNLIYRLDNGFPINPFGRTGLKGRGSLPRWGPNHYLMLIVTRWRTTKYVGGKICEFLAKTYSHRITLPTVFVSGSDKYSKLKDFFHVPKKAVWNNDKSVIDFFAECVDVSQCNENTSDTIRGLSFEIHKAAYMDDPYNTDQAWKEVKLFQFHFTLDDNLHTKLKKEQMIGWRVVTEDILIKIPAGESNLLQRVINKLKPVIV